MKGVEWMGVPNKRMSKGREAVSYYYIKSSDFHSPQSSYNPAVEAANEPTKRRFEVCPYHGSYFGLDAS